MSEMDEIRAEAERRSQAARRFEQDERNKAQRTTVRGKAVDSKPVRTRDESVKRGEGGKQRKSSK